MVCGVVALNQTCFVELWNGSEASDCLPHLLLAAEELGEVDECVTAVRPYIPRARTVTSLSTPRSGRLVARSRPVPLPPGQRTPRLGPKRKLYPRRACLRVVRPCTRLAYRRLEVCFALLVLDCRRGVSIYICQKHVRGAVHEYHALFRP